MITLIKLSDDVFNGNHPNSIYTGYMKQLNQEVIELPVVSVRYWFGSLLTSTVTKILDIKDDEVIFKTKNSTYKLIKQ